MAEQDVSVPKKKRRLRKYFFRVLFWGFIVFLLSLANSKMQTFIANKALSFFTEKAGGEVSFSDFYASPFTGLHFKDLLIYDLKKDTLFFVEECRIDGDLTALNEEEIQISDLELKNVYYNLYSINRDEQTNMQFIIEAFNTPSDSSDLDSVSAPFILNVARFKLDNLRFDYASFTPQKGDTGVVNFDLIKLKEFDIEADNLRLVNDSIVTNLKKFSLKEQSGLNIEEISGLLTVSSTVIQIDEGKIKTPLSEAFFHSYSMKSREWGDYADFFKKIRLDVKLKPSLVSMKDIAFFTSYMKGIDISYRVLGKASGTVSNLKSKNLSLEWGEKFKLQTDVAISGLPEPDETFVDLNIKNMDVDFNYADQVFKASPTFSHLYIPQSVKNFQKIKYKGRATGFINDLVAYGTFSTNNSNIKTDLRYFYDTQTSTHQFIGEVMTDSLNLSQLNLEDTLFGKINAEAQVLIKIDSLENVEGDVEADIPSVEINHYKYRNIHLKAFLNENVLKSNTQINDPFCKADIAFNLDFNKEPIIDFKSSVERLNLVQLNWLDRDTNNLLSFSTQAHFVSTDFDKIKGEIALDSLLYMEKEKKIFIPKIHLRSVKKDGIRDINVQSDLVDAHIRGRFLFKNLQDRLYYFLNKHIPSSHLLPEKELPSNQDVTFSLDLKNTEPVLEIFYEDLSLANRTQIKGHFSTAQEDVDLVVKSDLVKYLGVNYHQLDYHVYTDSLHAQINSDLKFHKIDFSDDLFINRVLVKQFVRNDTLSTLVNWQDTVHHTQRANLSNETVFNKIGHDSISFDSHFYDSFFYVQDSLWQMSPSNIKMRGANILFEQFALLHGNQYLTLNGELNKKEKKGVRILSQDINLSMFPYLKQLVKVDLGGYLSSDLELSYEKEVPIIDGMLSIKSLSINKQLFGNLTAHTNWMSKSNKLMLRINNKLGKKQFTNLTAEGFIDFKHEKIDLDWVLNKQKLSFIKPFVDEYLDHVGGFLSGNIKISGAFDKIKYDGYLDFSRAKFKILYLGTQYNFTNQIRLKDNKIILDGITLHQTDGLGDYAKVKGYIKHNNFLDMEYNINIDKRNFMVLNTSSIDNNLFFGRAFLTGITNITGDNDNLKINIVGATNRNTQFNVPLDGNEEASGSNFIKFVNHAAQEGLVKKYKADLSGILLNFDLKVTPDAELQLIFNSQLGDIVKATGSGNLNMEINTLGNFKLYGAYTIQKGAYLFTLQNIINKKFNVEKGGYIKWSGDPYSAYVNLNAIYKLKASLYELTLDEKDKKRIPINCYLKMENDLMQPDIKFDIKFPSSGDQANNLINAMDQDEKNRQLLSLLVLNQFDTPDYLKGGARGFNSGNTVGKTASELLSNQVSSWLSQISDDFDIGFNYRPADEINSSEVELALSTQLFNNRVEIDGNLGVGTYYQENTNVVGNVNIDVKLNKKGNIRFRAFNRVNDNYLEYNSLYTQGIGLYYREDFDSFGQLLKKYWRFVTFRKPDEEKE